MSLRLLLNKITHTSCKTGGVCFVLFLFIGAIIFFGSRWIQSANALHSDSNNLTILSNIVDPEKQNIKFFWKDANNNRYASLQYLKTNIEENNQQLIFAVNGGMYDKNHNPKGLYIENGAILSPIDKVKEGYGNFYLTPNGVFYLKYNGKAFIQTTQNLYLDRNIKYATQSGPMLVIDGDIHPKFTKGSKHKNIRNGVGILPNGNVLFAMSKKEMSLYEFASFFKDKGCKNALYLDGFISKTYLPSKDWEQMGGDFGVIIGVVK